ncbi:MAG: histidine phosphatase family protein [Anaerolineae bacterium]
MPQPTTEFILVRHGQTDWNIEGRYQGQIGPGLNAKGRDQAAATARSLIGREASALYTSDLARALETAQIIGAALGLTPQPDARLRELHQGRWQGMLYADIQREYAEALGRFREDPLHYGPPGGETLADLRDRLFAFLQEKAVAHPDQTVIAVTHKLPIALLRCMESGAPLNHVWEYIPENAAAITLRYPVDVPAAR